MTAPQKPTAVQALRVLEAMEVARAFVAPAFVALAVLAPVALFACRSGAAQRESAALADAVDRYRTADDGAKSTRAQGVLSLACTEAAVCTAKRVCLAAIEPTTRALELKSEVTQRLADLEQKRLSPDSPEAESLPAKLDEATRLLQEGRSKMTDCDKSLVDLRLQFGG
jgi:hypothetical protein